MLNVAKPVAPESEVKFVRSSTLPAPLARIVAVLGSESCVRAGKGKVAASVDGKV